MNTTDCLNAMLLELLSQRPPVYDCDSRTRWLAAIGSTIAGMPSIDQRLDAIKLVALDLRFAYGLRKEVAEFYVQVAVFSAAEVSKCQ